MSAVPSFAFFTKVSYRNVKNQIGLSRLNLHGQSQTQRNQSTLF